MENVKADKMKRGEFLRSLGLSTSTLMAFYCIGTTMTACGSSDDDPTPNPGGGGGAVNGVTGTTTGNSINFKLDLTHDNAKDLKTAGTGKIFGDVLVAFTTANQYVALSRICTHEGNDVRYRKDQNDIQCPSHLSEFTLAGAVQKGPATAALTTYKTSLSTDGNTLTVTT